MPAKPLGRRLAPGVWEDDLGWTIIATYGKKDRTQFRIARVDPPPSVLVLKRRRAEAIAQLKTDRQAATTAEAARQVARAVDAATIAGACQAFRETLPATSTFLAAVARKWETDPAVKDRPLATLTRDAIRKQLNVWRKAGYSASQVNHFKVGIAAVWRSVYGDEAPNPGRQITRHAEPRPELRAVPRHVVDAVLAAIPDTLHNRLEADGRTHKPNLAKIRIRILATTAIPQAMLCQIRRENLDFTTREIYIPPRGKGAGADGRTLELIPPAVEAFKDLDAAGGFGRFNVRSLSRVFARAVVKARAQYAAKGKPFPVPPTRVDVKGRQRGFRAYDMRHTFLTAVYNETHDPLAVQELGLLGSLAMTPRYAHGAVSAVARRAAKLVAIAFRRSQKRTLPTTMSLPRPKKVVGGAKLFRKRA